MTQHKEEQMNEALALFYFAYKTFTEKPDEIIKRVWHTTSTSPNFIFYRTLSRYKRK